MKNILKLIKFPVMILSIILIVSFTVRVYNINYNSPFLDEAQYIVLGQKVLAGHWQESNPFSWVGGMPLFYPPLSAIFEIFGIIGSRFLNVLLGTLSVYLIYEFTKSLRFSSKENENRTTGLIAGSFLATLAVPMYLSRLAIYDMLSFTLFLLGMVFFIKGLTLVKPDLWQRENRFFIAAIALASSFLAKYIALILLPMIVFFGLWHMRRQGVEHMEMKGIVTRDETKLENFFGLWGKEFTSIKIFDKTNSDKKVRMIVNGKENTQFENYQMREGDIIEIKYE